MQNSGSNRLQQLSILLLLLFTAESMLIPIFVTAGQLNTDAQIQAFQYTETEIPILGGTEVELITSDTAFDGYNLFDLARINLTDRWATLARSIVLLTMNGTPVIEIPALSSPVEMMNSTTILCDSADGATLWNLETGSVEHLGFTGHHEYEYNDSNESIFTLQQTFEIHEDIPFTFDVIAEFSMNGTLLWSLDTTRFINRYQRCPIHAQTTSFYDITHGNSLFFDPDEDVIYYNARNQNTFYKIDHKTGEVIWGLGEWGDFTLYDQNGDERTNLFYHAHSVEPINDYTFILFDNDFHNQTDQDSHNSRILEITIDEMTMTANNSWSWTAPPEYYSSYWGDADRLPNGNRLGTFGTDWKYDENIGAVLVEVDELGNIVWEMRFPNTEAGAYGVYRMERIRLAPILDSPMDIHAPYRVNVDVSWQAWYNFRPKRTISAPYLIYVNGILVDSGTVEYDKFWRSTTVSYTIVEAPFGTTNLTLVVYDDGGHYTSDTVIILVDGDTDTGSLILIALFLSSVLALSYLDRGDPASPVNAALRHD